MKICKTIWFCCIPSHSFYDHQNHRNTDTRLSCELTQLWLLICIIFSSHLRFSLSTARIAQFSLFFFPRLKAAVVLTAEFSSIIEQVIITSSYTQIEHHFLLLPAVHVAAAWDKKSGWTESGGSFASSFDKFVGSDERKIYWLADKKWEKFSLTCLLIHRN